MELVIRPQWEFLKQEGIPLTGISMNILLSRPCQRVLDTVIPVEAGQQEIIIPCPGVKLWDCEHPNLYDLEAELAADGTTVARRKTKVGFRHMERKGKQVFWNGAPLKLKGICYRERPDSPETTEENSDLGERFNSEGKLDFSEISDCGEKHHVMEETRQDLLLFAEANINFIRGIYGPFSDAFLDLCDEMGFLVENTAPFAEIGGKKPALQDLPHCLEEFLDPVRKMLAGGSHVSILIWSLGHDCAWGANFREAARLIRSRDQVRLLTFHLPMSVPEEEEQIDVWPVHYIDYRQPFHVCYDQMVIFHTPGADNEIGYMTGSAPSMDIPVLHEIWSPVACHNRDEIRHDGAIREFWGKSIRRFAEKSWETPGCLGGAVLAGVDEDGSFEGMGEYEWGILNRNHQPKPEYFHIKSAYSPVVLKSVTRDGYRNKLVLEVENRFLHSSLDRVSLAVNGELQDISLTGEPGSRQKMELADSREGELKFSFILTQNGCCLSEYVWSGEKMCNCCKSAETENIRQENNTENNIETNHEMHTRNLTEANQEKCTEHTAEIYKVTDKDKYNENRHYDGAEFTLSETDDLLIIENTSFQYIFSKKTCLLVRAAAGNEEILAGGPYLCSTRFLLGDWKGQDISAVRSQGKVRVYIRGGFQDACDIRFILTLFPDGALETAYEVSRLYRHMPHTVKAEIGMDVGGLNEKGVSYLLSSGMSSFSWKRTEPECRDGFLPSYPDGHIGRLAGEVKWSPESENGEDFFSSKHHISLAEIIRDNGSGVRAVSNGKDSVRLERAPGFCPEAVVNDRDERMEYQGKWYLMDDYCGNLSGTESLSAQAMDTMTLAFRGTGIRLYGPMDINYGICNIYVDGKMAAEGISQYPDQVDFPGMSRGFEKRYQCLLFEIHGLKEGEHTLTVQVTGEKEAGAQNTYTSIDHAVLEGRDYKEGLMLTVNQDYNYARLVRGNYRRPKVELVCGQQESFTLKLLAPGIEGGKSV